MWINNLLKAFLSFFICGFAGQVIYHVFLNQKNLVKPHESEPATSIVSLIIFVISIWVTYKIQVLGSLTNKGVEERELLEAAFK